MNRKSLQLTAGYINKKGEFAATQVFSCEFSDFSDAIEMVVRQEEMNMLKGNEKENYGGNQFEKDLIRCFEPPFNSGLVGVIALSRHQAGVDAGFDVITYLYCPHEMDFYDEIVIVGRR